MNKIYLLKSNVVDFSSFIQNINEGGESISGLAMDQEWKRFNNYHMAVKLELRKSDSNKKNFNFDFSGALRPFFIISELALDKLRDIFESRGQVLPVITESKKKSFFGYYPTNPLSGCFDKEKSIYREYPKGLMIDKPVLLSENITDEYLFSIEEDISRVFVTDKFKQRVEEAGLLGFDFSVEIPLT